jgi:phosphonoacetaldehyde hydrolase
MTVEPSPLRAVILDWAGTTVDYGSRAPVEVFIEIFRQRGVAITDAEARGPMGRSKHEHIAAILELPRIAALWRRQHGRDPDDRDMQAMYHDFLPLQKRTLERGSEVIPGVPEAIAQCRRQGLKIGSTTGYTRELMEVVLPRATCGGYLPDVTVCSDDVSAGRPAPWMNFLAAERLGVYPMSAVMTVDDTPIGIDAGLNAGTVTVAVSQTGNSLGLSAAEVAALAEADLNARLAVIEETFRQAGAHFVIRSVAQLPALLAGLKNGAFKLVAAN